MPDNFNNNTTNFLKQILVDNPEVATRKASQLVLEKMTVIMPEMFGGSADLTSSNLTNVNKSIWLNYQNNNANYLSYGVREFGMAAIMNGIVLHGGYRPYGGTFLVFIDYARNAIRMSALMKIPVVYVMTHDSIGLGEDGPTHQPVEHLDSLRLIPNLNVWRPADAYETQVAWNEAISTKKTPSVLALSRQSLPMVVTSMKQEEGIKKGGYLLVENSDAHVTLVATGSEVQLALKASKALKSIGIKANVASIPCLDIFDQQSNAYQKSIIKI